MSRVRLPSKSWTALAITGLLVIGLASPAPTLAAVSQRYDFSGWEVWATPTVGTFVGTATGTSGDLATWRASIEHTVQTIPDGKITGGYASLVTSDLTRVRGDFTGGTLVLVNSGTGSCGNLTHEVEGKLRNVTRSDTGATGGKAKFIATLVHYRASVFGSCIAYSASARGYIELLP